MLSDYEDRVLELVGMVGTEEEPTQSDLQGAVSALVLEVYNAGKAEQVIVPKTVFEDFVKTGEEGLLRHNAISNGQLPFYKGQELMLMSEGNEQLIKIL